MVKKKKTDFDWTKSYDELKVSNMFKQGLKDYILTNKLEIKTEKEFMKIVEDYRNLQIGGL